MTNPHPSGANPLSSRDSIMNRCCTRGPFLFLSTALLWAVGVVPAADLPRLKISDNHRYLVTEQGVPFVWLGDTAWELFHRLNREEALTYLDARAAQGFNVVQAVALAELDGLNVPNAYGHTPLLEHDPTRPRMAEGPQNDYWDHVDFVISQANQRGIYIGLLPTWGDKWNRKWGVGPEIFQAGNAEAYGKWLGERYQHAGVIWILGGDRPIENEQHAAIIRAMARGIRAGDQQRNLITFHPTGGRGSSDPFHDDDWLDFNMRQNGHVTEFTGRYDATLADYQRSPIKPVLDGEPIYEDHPVSFKADELGHSVAGDVRRPLYWNLFSGAFGHTYGHHSVWQMWTPERAPINHPLMPWSQAIHQPGANQMRHGRALLESRPLQSRIPDPSVIVTDRVPTSVPGAGRYRFAATRDSEGTYAMVYAPVGRPFRVRMDVIRGPKVQAWWFNPRNGQASSLDVFDNRGTREFVSPDPGELLDWVLVLDDESQGYPPPGQKPAN
jgi:hypothetical protein